MHACIFPRKNNECLSMRDAQKVEGMMKRAFSMWAAVCLVAATASATMVTGDPSADGWGLAGHSLANGTYVKGVANYGYDAYGAGFSVQAGSNLEIADGSLSWAAGDTILGVGGVFRDITAAEAGWPAFSGPGVNSLLPTSAPYSGPKLQAKFGNADATWSASTTAPNGGNGNSSSSSGGARIQVRTSAYFQAGTPHPDQEPDAPWTWDGHSGQLLLLEEDGHIKWRSDGSDDISPDKRVARMIWNWDDTANQVASWQLLLNVSLLDRLYPTYDGLLPDIGDMAIMTVQDNDSDFTDALVTTVPEPATLALLGLGGLLLRKRS